MWETLMHAGPAVALLAVALLGLAMKKIEDGIGQPEDRFWPFAQKPGLAMELADSQQFVAQVLQSADTEAGTQNRALVRKVQYLDFALIPLYVLFFGIAAHGNALACTLALAAGIADYFEDFTILRILNPGSTASVKRVGQAKWLLYFATLSVEGALLFGRAAPRDGRDVAAWALGILLLGIAIGGIISSLRGSFEGILSATTSSFIGMLGLAVAPLLAWVPVSWGVVVQYLFWLRVPVVVGVLLLVIPILSFTVAKSLLRGLFDLTPQGILFVTATTLTVAGAVTTNASLIMAHAHERFLIDVHPVILPDPWWLGIIALLGFPTVASAVWFSIRQKQRPAPCVGMALLGYALVLVAAFELMRPRPELASLLRSALGSFEAQLAATSLFAGYADPARFVLLDHLQAMAGYLASLLLYAVLGVVGRAQLGKRRTVPALCSALMLILMVAWPLSAAAFFFDAWRFPVLLVVLAAGTLTAQSAASDHYYELIRRETSSGAAAPARVITATHKRRVVVVAASGGGIQAGAWTAQVLYGLQQDSAQFRDALRVISSVSGGSVGTAHFVQWLANPSGSTLPAEAAAESSLDEVAWGLAWPDFLRSLLPWVFRKLIGRGRALELAWRMNGSRTAEASDQLASPLSNWNARTERGELPAVVLNATIAETGERLLLATTGMGGGAVVGRARVDGFELHTINQEHLDSGVITAARLSASFPYVTPAARSDGAGPQPHVVDGGYYDNYGLATLVEWLDSALEGSFSEVQDVLVVKIRGLMVETNPKPHRFATDRGWFYQAFAPLATLASVRGAGQLAHNDIEIQLLQEKWKGRVSITEVLFEFPSMEAPLSWHLTPDEKLAIRDSWATKMNIPRQTVKTFLEGNQFVGTATAK